MDKDNNIKFKNIKYTDRAFMTTTYDEYCELSFNNNTVSINCFINNSHCEVILPLYDFNKWTLSGEDYDLLISKLNALKLDEWNHEYRNPNVLDGGIWKLNITYKDDTQLEIYGINAYPKQWKQFRSFLKWLKSTYIAN